MLYNAPINEGVLMYIDFSDFSQLIELMNNAEKYKSLIVSENENNEKMIIGIYENYISTETYQHNGWIRENYFRRDGTTEELFSR